MLNLVVNVIGGPNETFSKLNEKTDMRKVIAAINLTLDGNCDHRAGIPDDEIHQHYTELLNQSDVMLYGRITYQLMEYWREVLENPTGFPAADEFAVGMDRIKKVVFSNTLGRLDWQSAKLANQGLSETISLLKKEAGREILIGSPSLIAEAMNLNLIDEYQICIQPVIAGEGLRLFNLDKGPIKLQLLKTKTFGGGAVLLYYRPA